MFRALLADPEFRRADFDIGWLDRKLAAGELRRPESTAPSDLPLLAAAIEHAENLTRQADRVPEGGGARAHWRQAARDGALRRGR